jgi:FkbM family methyltransferase
MSATLSEAAARGLGNIRLGRRPIPGQGRVVDAIGKMKSWMGGNLGVASPWPGVRFEVDLTDRIQRQMWAGVYAQHVRNCFDVLLQPGDGYIDVGGHIGYHAVAAAHRVGASGWVAAFEADPAMYMRLMRNLEQFPWAQAVHAAVWQSSRTLTFERSSVQYESGWGSLTNVRDLGAGEHVDVRAISLDDWCREGQVTRWDAMKLDAEGAELSILRGAQDSIGQFRPSIVLEINGILLEQAGSSSMKVVEFLQGKGYRLFHLTYRRLEQWDPARHAQFSETLCLHRDRATAVLGRLARAGFAGAD